ncbi:hypothetical protein ZYGR_0I06110 [Zygosaccharomyces rouxii]|uniref:ZYRO0C14520p n=2 Tax=Zygosaccharomyces rouxii TaxID=4956 RepID=C5DU76_ZYGRC|nr:uncharacterized protein ZYRO0C14520g [Zygosaccharomyces rouxii]GAV48314.1 hypothetical protein ZYGR_0I06110 [Zygosaccharomyces rouxii]CAR27337.1 ZYRO0C14520p [Zygosaccharomyces rouxii]
MFPRLCEIFENIVCIPNFITVPYYHSLNNATFAEVLLVLSQDRKPFTAIVIRSKDFSTCRLVCQQKMSQ